MGVSCHCGLVLHSTRGGGVDHFRRGWQGSLAASGGDKKKKRVNNRTRLSLHDAPSRPPTSWVPPCGSPPQDPSVEPDQNGPHPSGKGRGALLVAVRGWERVDGGDGEGGGVGMREV